MTRKPLPTRNEVLDLIASEDGAMHAREVAQRLSVPEGSYDGLLRVLDDLVFDGVLVVRGGQRYRVDTKRAGKRKSDREKREGVVKINPRGFGFVASPIASGDDVFVNAESLGGAMHGDRVVVEIVARSSRGAEGQIVEVKERATPRVSGILRRRGKSAWVEPDDPRVRGPVVLTSDVDLRGPEGNSGNEGQVVVVQVTKFPQSPEENPEGKLLAVLGAPGELGREPWFSRDAIRTAAAWAGMADAAADAALADLAARGEPDDLRALGAGRIVTARATIDRWLEHAAAAADADPQADLRGFSVQLREAIATAGRTILDEAARACGSRPFATGTALDRARRDFELFVLQHRLDPMVARLGREALT